MTILRHTILVVFLAMLQGTASAAWADLNVSSKAVPTADLIVVYKSSRKLVLFRDRQPLKAYRVGLGWSPLGDKFREGDGRTPEGTYFIDRRNPESRYHLSLGISYPNHQDRAEAHARGVSPGGDIFIHGAPQKFWTSILKRDWTAGCIAVSNRDIEEIWSMVPTGTPIVIQP